ncbi:hypothetical protein IL306_009310 [Fusarium sp. DS 682]|nr:hypothetical protein IL306_009310 [Fusarium sp. DS 682]
MSIGDPSVHAFLQRVTSHLAQVGQGLPRSLFNPSSETVADTDVYSIRTLILPDKQVAKDCIAAYFDHGNATCRFLLPTDMYHLLDLLYDNDAAILQNHAQMAIIVLLIGTGCVWSASLRNEPVAPWRAKASTRNLPQEIFILVYLHNRSLGRYLAVILGRPVAIHESATDVKLSVDLDPVAQAAIGDERKLLVGTVAHAGLVRIIGNTMESLYSAPRHGVAPTEEKVARLENELHDWVNRTPKFFHLLHRRAEGFEEGFYEVPWILRRQQRTVHATFYFANMLLYRGHLLRDFLDHAPSTPQSGPIPDPIAKCVENAKLMVALAKEFGADKYNGTFWVRGKPWLALHGRSA